MVRLLTKPKLQAVVVGEQDVVWNINRAILHERSVERTILVDLGGRCSSRCAVGHSTGGSEDLACDRIGLVESANWDGVYVVERYRLIAAVV